MRSSRLAVGEREKELCPIGLPHMWKSLNFGTLWVRCVAEDSPVSHGVLTSKFVFLFPFPTPPDSPRVDSEDVLFTNVNV